MLTFVLYKTTDKMGMDTTDITAAMIADKMKIRPDTMARTVRRKLGTGYGLHTPLSPEQVSALSAKKKTGSVRSLRADKPMAATGTTALPEVVTPPATVKENLTTRPLFNPAYLKAIIYGHAVLIFADLVILYSVPGAIAGLLVGFFMHSAVALADRPELNRTSAFALWICFGLDGLAWFVHVPAFRDSVSADVSDLVTQFLAGVVCAMSFAALYALRDSKLD